MHTAALRTDPACVSQDMYFGDAEQGALVKVWAAKELGWNTTQLEVQLGLLCRLIPDISACEQLQALP